MHKVIFLMFGLCLLTTGLTGQPLPEPTGLLPGEPAPDFLLSDQRDSLVRLSDALKKGPVVLVFYRGQWCPYCDKHLSALQDSLPMITRLGATVMAISPEKPAYLQQMADKTAASFTLLYDKDYLVAKAYGILFDPGQANKDLYNTRLQANLREAHGNALEWLPVPATYIIRPDRRIAWRQLDPNYRIRSTVKDIIHHIPR